MEIQDEGLPVDELLEKHISSPVISAIAMAMKSRFERTQSVAEFISNLSSDDTVVIPNSAEVERKRKEAEEKAAKEKAEAERKRKEAEEKAAKKKAEAERKRKEAEEKVAKEKAEVERKRKEAEEKVAKKKAEVKRKRKRQRLWMLVVVIVLVVLTIFACLIIETNRHYGYSPDYDGCYPDYGDSAAIDSSAADSCAEVYIDSADSVKAYY